MKDKLIKIAFLFSQGIALLSAIAMFILENSFAANPISPRPEINQVVPYDFKSIIRFITPNEYLWIRVIHFAFFAAFLGIGIFGYLTFKKEGWPNRKGEPILEKIEKSDLDCK